MDLTSLIFDALSKIPMPGQGQTTGIAQDRFTHTPMALGNYPDLANRNMVANYAARRSWGDEAFNRGISLGGISPSMPGGSIEVNIASPEYDASYLRHEVIHAAVRDDLDPSGKLYKQVGQLLPEGVKNYTGALYTWNKIPFDLVHESLPTFLTDPQFAGKEYNAAKLKVINAFPAATKAKLTRIMAAQQGQ